MNQKDETYFRVKKLMDDYKMDNFVRATKKAVSEMLNKIYTDSDISGVAPKDNEQD
jgi:hypothetical protein